MRTTAWLRLGLLAAGAALATGACSSGSSARSSSGVRPPAADTTITTRAVTSAATAPISATPIKVGFINQESSPLGSFTETTQEAEGAVRYINSELGGVRGHPIALDTCIVAGNPGSSASCGTQMVRDKVVAVAAAYDFFNAASLPIIKRAGLPYLGYVPLTASDLTRAAVPPSGFMYPFLPGSAGEFPGQAAFIAHSLKAKKVTILTSNNGPGRQAAQQLLQAPLRAYGLTNVTVVTEDASAADFKSSVTVAERGNPDVIDVLFVQPGCSRIMRAIKSLGVTAKVIYPAPCADKAVLDAGGGGADGAYFSLETLPPVASEADSDVKAYLGAQPKYVPQVSDPQIGMNGFTEMMNVYEVLTKVGPDATPASINTFMSSASNEPNFMAHPYTCDGKQIPGLDVICDPWIRMVQANGDTLTDLGSWVNAGTGRSEPS